MNESGSNSRNASRKSRSPSFAGRSESPGCQTPTLFETPRLFHRARSLTCPEYKPQLQSVKDENNPLVAASKLIGQSYLDRTRRAIIRVIPGFNKTEEFVSRANLIAYYEKRAKDPRFNKEAINRGLTEYNWLIRRNGELGISNIQNEFTPIHELPDQSYLFVQMPNGEVRVCLEQDTGHLILATGVDSVIFAGGFTISGGKLSVWHHQSGAYCPVVSEDYLRAGQQVDSKDSETFLGSPFPVELFDYQRAIGGPDENIASLIEKLVRSDSPDSAYYTPKLGRASAF